jgi:hypothetical protein
LDRLTDALTEHDRDAFESTLSEQDPGFASRAAMIFTNLERIRPTRFSLRATGRTRPLSPNRRGLLGEDARVVEVAVDWQVPGDADASDQALWLTVVTEDGEALLAGVTDGPDQPTPTPLWWCEPIRLGHTRHATVIGGARTDVAAWADRAETAALAIAEQLTADGADGQAPGARWNGRVVMLVPSNESLLEQVTGTAPGSQSGLAAITWPDGSQLSRAPMRILINPGGRTTPSEDDLGTALVLAHETVHVATRSPASAAPTWLVEGFAEQLAYRAYPAAAGPAEDLVLAEVVRSGAPTELPSEQDFDRTGTRLDLAYAQSWLVCRDLGHRYGSSALLDFYRRVGRGDGVEAAAGEAFGIGRQQLIKDWQQTLTAAARERG